MKSSWLPVSRKNVPIRTRRTRRPRGAGFQPGLECLEDRIVLSPGALDPTFGAGGLVLSDFGQETRANAVALQADGKIVVAGQTSFPNSDGSNNALARYNRDGTLDSTFGTGGHVYLPHTNQDSHHFAVSSVIIQPDGDIVPVEFATDATTLGLARFLPDGSPDTTFGPNGDGFTSAYPGGILGAQFALYGDPGAAALQADGKIVVASTAYDANGRYTDFLLARFNPDGSLDGGFGTGGMLVTTFGYGGTFTFTSPPPPDVFHDDAIASGVAIQADGKIVAVGATRATADSSTYTIRPNQFALARYNTDGSLDNTFGAGGLVTTNVDANPFGGESFSSVALQADGKIVAAGSVGEQPGDGNPFPTVSQFAVARYNADGSLDSGFGTGGLVETTFVTGDYAAISGIALQADGKIVAVGYSGADPGDGLFTSFAIARYDADGRLDNGFGTAGKVLTSFDPDPSAFSSAAGVVIQPDGNIVAAGTAQTGGGYRDVVLARYLGDPTAAAGADLAVTQAASANPALAGMSLTYTLTVTNHGPDNATGVMFTDTLPAGVVFVSATASQGTSTQANGVLTCNLGTLANGVSATITLTVNLPSAGTISNTAGATADQPDPDPSNNGAGATETVNPVTAQNLQSAINAAPGNPITFLAGPAQAAAIIAAVNGLSAQAAPVTIVLNLAGGIYAGVTVSAPAGVTLVIKGNGTATDFVGQSPALTVTSGVVVVSGVTFTNATAAPTVLVSGGALKLRHDVIQESSGYDRAAVRVAGGSADLGTAADPGGNTLNLNGPGEFIGNVGPNPVPAIGDTFAVDGAQLDAAQLAADFRIAGHVFDALDAGGGGLVTFVADNVYVTRHGGSIQRAVDSIPAGYTIHVPAGDGDDFGDYAAGAKPLTVVFQNGPTLSLRNDLPGGQTTLRVTGAPGANQIAFREGITPAAVRVAIDDFPTGTFVPTGRIVAHGGGDNAHIQVSDRILLPALLFADGANGHLQGGGGPTVEVGGTGNSYLEGGKGRTLLIAGQGSAHLKSHGQGDILIGGFTDFDGNEAALSAIMAEWATTYDPADALHDYQIRVGHLRGTLAGGLNGPALLTADAVHDNGHKDVLQGGGGHDLFFATLHSPNKDKLDGVAPGDVLVDLGL